MPYAWTSNLQKPVGQFALTFHGNFDIINRKVILTVAFAISVFQKPISIVSISTHLCFLVNLFLFSFFCFAHKTANFIITRLLNELHTYLYALLINHIYHEICKNEAKIRPRKEESSELFTETSKSLNFPPIRNRIFLSQFSEVMPEVNSCKFPT